MTQPRILVAGVGNLFCGDDGFGVEVVRQLADRTCPESVRVVDFGIRALDLAYALLDGYDAVVIVDAIRRRVPQQLVVGDELWRAGCGLGRHGQSRDQEQDGGDGLAAHGGP